MQLKILYLFQYYLINLNANKAIHVLVATIITYTDLNNQILDIINNLLTEVQHT